MMAPTSSSSASESEVDAPEGQKIGKENADVVAIDV